MSWRSPSRDLGFGAQGSTGGDGVSHSDVFARRSDVGPTKRRTFRALKHGPRSRIWAQLDGAWDDLLVCTLVSGALHGDHQETINRSHTSGKRLYRRQSTHRRSVDDEY